MTKYAYDETSPLKRGDRVMLLRPGEDERLLSCGHPQQILAYPAMREFGYDTVIKVVMDEAPRPERCLLPECSKREPELVTTVVLMDDIGICYDVPATSVRLWNMWRAQV